MAGIRVEKQELLTVHASDGSEVRTGDLVIMRTYIDEDVLCRYKGVEGGYAPVEATGRPVRFRMGRQIPNAGLEDIRDAWSVEE